MSFFTNKYHRKRFVNDIEEFVEEDYIFENPLYKPYAIKQKKPYLDGTGYYYTYIIDPLLVDK